MAKAALNIGQELHSDSIVYRIESVLGQGSFGVTYKAKAFTVMKGRFGEELVETNTPKAIKEFFMKEVNDRDASGSITGMSEGSLSYNYAQKFKKEAENLASMNHPNIVKVIDFISANNTYYYVMDYIDGENLNDYLKHHKMSEKEATDTISEVAKALQYMHEEKHMLHLDLKPGNIMRRNSDGHIFLIDFGLSKHYSEDGVPETSTSVGLGTPGYAPIEQANIKSVKQFKRTLDIYSLGATFYKLLTGNIPPTADELVSDKDIIKDELEKISNNETIVSTILNAMSPSIKERTQCVSAFLSNLKGDNENVQVIDVEDQTDWQQNDSTENQDHQERVTPERIRKHEWVFSKKIHLPVILGLCLICIALLLFFNRRNYNQDYSPELVKAATNGDKLAQYWLGDCYYLGRGVSINYDEAFKWYMKSAEQGLDSAQISVANCYSDAEGVEQDFSKALFWINKAVSQNNSLAINNLGNFYWYGNGVKVDTVKAVELYRESAEKGCSAGMINLGYLYLDGTGVKSDTIKAIQLFEDAEKKKKYSAATFFSAYYRGKYGLTYRDSVKCIKMLTDKLEHAKDTTNIRATYCLIADFYELSEGVHENSKEAFKWYSKAAELGSATGMYWTGMSYIWGSAVEKDFKKAFYWINKCANLNIIPWKGKSIQEANRQYKNISRTQYCVVESQRTLSGLYYNGDGVSKDFGKYIYWLQEAAKNGSNKAQHSLGHLYKEGDAHAKKDIKEAYKWFKIAVENGHGEACVDMAFAYFEGREGYNKNDKEGIKYLELGASRNDPLATFNLGIMYYYGDNGLPVDKVKAKQYLSRAKEFGYERADDAIKDLF